MTPSFFSRPIMSSRPTTRTSSPAQSGTNPPSARPATRPILSSLAPTGDRLAPRSTLQSVAFILTPAAPGSVAWTSVSNQAYAVLASTIPTGWSIAGTATSRPNHSRPRTARSGQASSSASGIPEGTATVLRTVPRTT